MNDTQDFEAIGRYHYAMERVRALSVLRHNTASEVSRLLQGACATVGADAVKRFDHAPVIKKVEELADANIKLEAAIAEVEAYAHAAGKPGLIRI